MQTFLPYKDFTESAKILDYRRLGKQRVEAWQIYEAITKGTGWKNHPISKMWTGFENALLQYGIIICTEWINRGYKDTMLPRFVSEKSKYPDEIVVPTWLDENFCKSHQSNLLRKNKEYYQKYFPDVEDNLPYLWPTKERRKNDSTKKNAQVIKVNREAETKETEEASISASAPEVA
jgi:hypothetical protein